MKSWYSVAMVLLAWPAWADVVQLNDGTKLEGTIQRESGGWIVTEKSGKVTHVPDSRVDGIEKTGTADAATTAESRLNLLRRNVEGLSDLNQIIDRYSKFIAESKGTPAAETARKELEAWKDRQAKGMVKVGKNWLTSDERMELLGKAAPMIEEARKLIKEGRYRDADGAINKLLALDPDNASGLYLRGVSAYKAEQLGQAKKAFERVREAMPNHGPTLNNLAVIAWRQEQYPAALLLYDQAMLGLPRDRRVLDNVAELLQVLPANLRDSNPAKKLARRFDEQDAELQKELAAQGLTRWGAAYLTKDQMTEVKRVRGKLDQVEQDREKMQARIDAIDQQIENNKHTMRDIDRDRQLYNQQTGNYTVLRRPSLYNELERENRRLRDEQADLINRLPLFDDKRRAIWQDSLVKPYTGMQRIIEVEGAPLTAPDGDQAGKAVPVTQPATRPA
ncbi:MAG: tetratricopeptide repeat protein [Bacillota bacterium]